MTHALLVVDIQHDFLPGGALAVSEGDQVIAVANSMMDRFPLVVATQDWHPAAHKSFAVNNGDKSPGEVIELHGLTQVLWPQHCVQGSHGAAFAQDLHSARFDAVFQKGTDVDIDSYSGFFDNGKRKDTGLADYLRSKGVTQVFVLGLATDYCVKYTAVDAHEQGFQTSVIRDGCRAVNLNPDDEQKAYAELEAMGIALVSSAELGSYR